MTKDKDNTNDWDYWFEQFNYAYLTENDGIINSNWVVNTGWGSEGDVPETVEFRFKTEPASTATPSSQSLWSLDSGTTVSAVLEYDTSLLTSGSFSGSTQNPNYKSGSLRLTTDDFATSTTLSLPFFDGGWWSVAISKDATDRFTIRSANSIYSGSNGSSLGWEASSSFTSDPAGWVSSTISYFPTAGRSVIGPGSDYVAFSGSYQEIRYYNTRISESAFKDYIMNPLSTEGNGINSAPNQLAFRAALTHSNSAQF